jgi:hypothetical protein
LRANASSATLLPSPASAAHAPPHTHTHTHHRTRTRTQPGQIAASESGARGIPRTQDVLGVVLDHRQKALRNLCSVSVRVVRSCGVVCGLALWCRVRRLGGATCFFDRTGLVICSAFHNHMMSFSWLNKSGMAYSLCVLIRSCVSRCRRACAVCACVRACVVCACVRVCVLPPYGMEGPMRRRDRLRSQPRAHPPALVPRWPSGTTLHSPFCVAAQTSRASHSRHRDHKTKRM